jgi:hypothetical protein
LEFGIQIAPWFSGLPKVTKIVNILRTFFLLRLFSYHSHVIGLPVPLVKAVKIPKPWHFDKRKGSTERLFRTQYIPLK